MVISFELNGKSHKLVLVKFEYLPRAPSITMSTTRDPVYQCCYENPYIGLFARFTSFPNLVAKFPPPHSCSSKTWSSRARI